MKRSKTLRKYVAICVSLIFYVSIADAQFVVRTIYFQPQGTPEKTAEIRKVMADVHEFFGREMHRYGYGPKSFRMEIDANGQPAVHIVKGRHAVAKYHAHTTYLAIEPELPAQFKNPNNVHVIFVGGMQHIKSDGITALGIGTLKFGNNIGGFAVLPGNNIMFRVVVHEVAHTFGLQHNLDPAKDFVMGLDAGREGFAQYEARWLDKSHYFNADHLFVNFVPRVRRIHPVRVIDIPKHIIEVKVDAESINGTHQAEMARPEDGGILDTYFLHAKPRDTAVFQFNVRLLRGGTQPWVRLIDTHGNIWMQPIDLDIPPAAFFETDPEPRTPLKPEPLKPTKPDKIRITSEPDEKKESAETPRHTDAHRKTLFLWGELKQR